jgi:hypothetical protein
MDWLRFLAFAGLAAAAATVASAASRPPIFADLADTARALPPEFAADALLRIAEAPTTADVLWKRQILEDAFHLAAAAQQPFARRNWTGWPGSIFDKSYAQGLDDKQARELFGEIPPPRIPSLSCDDALVYDVSVFYVTAGELAARAFNAKEVADEKPFHMLQRYAADMTSPAQAAPIARMLGGLTLKPEQFEALVDSFAGALGQLSGDDRSFSATMAGDAEAAVADLEAICARRRLNAQPLLEAWRAYTARQFSGARCADSVARVPGGDVKPASVQGKARNAVQCNSPQCLQLTAQFNSLILGPNGYGLTPEQKSTTEWGAKLRQYMSALADWTDDDDPVVFFEYKSRSYGDLFALSPNGPERDLLLSTLLAWLQQNGYQNEHRVEWFYAVNTLLIHAFADPVGMKTTIRDLQRSADPVIALYTQLEQLLPRPVEGTFGLL